MYKVGDAVKALYQDGSNGTVLGPGTVQSVVKHGDGTSTVTVAIRGERTMTYTVSSSGQSDYLMPA